ncbi:MAG: hypothetical protein KGL67_00880 [Patescibacteria group bacterium]|nr:hypothetical protein [Patescibacteria group bacterium]
MLKLYVGCGLTHASEEFKANVEELKEKFANIPGIQLLKFLGLADGTAHDVYVHDIINCVHKCNIMVAICDEPSIGLGWEMAVQSSRGKPLLAFGHDKSKITRLILDPRLPNYQFFRYQTFEEIYEIVFTEIRTHFHIQGSF